MPATLWAGKGRGREDSCSHRAAFAATSVVRSPSSWRRDDCPDARPRAGPWVERSDVKSLASHRNPDAELPVRMPNRCPGCPICTHSVQRFLIHYIW